MPTPAAKSNAALEPASTSARKSLAQRHENAAEHSNHVAAPLLWMQKTFGNQAVQRMLRTHLIQAKLTINQPGDEYEQEADRVADAVMQTPKTFLTPHLTSQAQEMQNVQRMCTECKEEEKQLVRTRRISEVQRCSCNSVGSGPPCEACQAGISGPEPVREGEDNRDEAPAAVHKVLGSSGHSLPTSVREEMESRFGGQDFSGVQVHTDAQATDSARAVSSLAYTVGNHVVFGEGQYSPTTSAGQHLLAHELAHVLQQRGGKGPVVQGKFGRQTTRDATKVAEFHHVAQSSGYRPPDSIEVNALHLQPVLQRAYNTPQKASDSRPASYKKGSDVISVIRSFEPCPCKTINDTRTGIFYNSDLNNLAIAYRHCSGGRTIDLYGQMQSNADAFLQGSPPQATAKFGIDINMVGNVVSGRGILEPLATSQDAEKGVGVHAQVIFEGGKWRIYIDTQYIRDLQQRAGGASLDHLDIKLGGQFGKISAQIVSSDVLSPAQRTVHGTLCFGDKDICPFIEVGPDKRVIGGLEFHFDQPKVRKEEKCETCLCPPPVRRYECVRYGQTERLVTTDPLRYYFAYDSTADSKDTDLQAQSQKTLEEIGDYVSRGYRIASISGYASPENIKPRHNERLSQNRADKLASLIAGKIGPRVDIPTPVGAGELVGRKPALPGQDLDDIARAAGFPTAEKVTELLTGAETLRPELVGQFLSLFKDPNLSDSGKIMFFGFAPDDPMGPHVLEAVRLFVSSKGKEAQRWNHIFPLLRYASVVLTGKEKEEARVGVGQSERVEESECADYGRELEKSESFGAVDPAALKPTADPNVSDDECAGLSNTKPTKDCDYALPKNRPKGTLTAPEIAPQRLQNP